MLEHIIAGNADHWSDRELHDRAWAIVQPLFSQDQAAARSLYAQLAPTGRATSEAPKVLLAACRGELEMLFVARDGQLWGTCDSGRNQVECRAASDESGAQELLNLAALHTLAHGGKVYTLDRSAMPDEGLLAGIFWLPLAKHGKHP